MAFESPENNQVHTELHNPKTLASVIESMWGGMESNGSGAMNIDDFYQTAYSNKFSDQERAAAYLVAENFDAISQLSGSHLLQRNDLKTLSSLTNQPTKPETACQDSQDSVAGNAVAVGLIVTTISALMGSKQSVKNGMAAAGTAAVVTAIKNSAGCQSLSDSH
jgi:hypothetical protein